MWSKCQIQDITDNRETRILQPPYNPCFSVIWSFEGRITWCVNSLGWGLYVLFCIKSCVLNFLHPTARYWCQIHRISLFHATIPTVSISLINFPFTLAFTLMQARLHTAGLVSQYFSQIFVQTKKLRVKPKKIKWNLIWLTTVLIKIFINI